jgi:hypothetical protein
MDGQERNRNEQDRAVHDGVVQDRLIETGVKSSLKEGDSPHQEQCTRQSQCIDWRIGWCRDSADWTWRCRRL